MKAPDDPRPVPAGMSAMLTISLAPPIGWRRRASRTRGWEMPSTVSDRSSDEYLMT